MKFLNAFAAAMLCSMSFESSAAQCDDNFKSSGSFLNGKTFQTFAEVPGVAADVAMRNLQAFTANDGFKIISVDTAQGVISAQQANGSSGRKMPLDINVEKLANGVKISMLYGTPAGTLSPADAVQAHFCKSIAAVSGPALAVSEAAAEPRRPAAPSPSGARRNLAPISAQQQAKIRSALAGKGLKDERAKQNLSEASETISAFLENVGCIPASDGGGLNVFAAPGHRFSPNGFASPMLSTRYHDKSACLSVVRIQGVTAPALNALRFEVVYLADDSGESTIKHHELVKQPDGQWLFNE